MQISRAGGALRRGMRAMPRMPVRAMHASGICRNAPQPLSVLSDEEAMLQEAVAAYARDVVAPKAVEMDEAEHMDAGIIRGLFENGYMGIETPPELGGIGGSFMNVAIVVEELAKADPSVSVLCDVQNTLVNTCFRKYGSRGLQERYLPQLAATRVGSFGLSEPSSGSDAFALKARAQRAVQGGEPGYVLRGSKMWITNAAEADVFIIFANLDPESGYKGITAFVVDREAGVEIAKKERKLGIRASSTCVITFDDVFVPEANRLGDEGQGYRIAIEILNEGRIGIAAQMVGLAQGVFDRAVGYCLNERKQFGQYIGTFQGMQFQFAQCDTEMEAARLLLYNAARLKDAGAPFVREAAIAKLYASQVAQRVSSHCIDWMGGVGFTRELGIEKFWRDSKIGSIYEGTSNIQLQTIAKLLSRRLQK